MSFNTPKRLTETGSCSQRVSSPPPVNRTASSQTGSQPLASISLTMSPRVLMAAAIAVRNSMEKRKRERSLSHGRSQEKPPGSLPRHSTPKMTRNDSPLCDKDTKKSATKKLFLDCTVSGDATETTPEENAAPSPTEKETVPIEETQPAAAVEETQPPRDDDAMSIGGISAISGGTAAPLNDTQMTWGGESGVSGVSRAVSDCNLTIASIRTTHGGKKAAAANAHWTDLLKLQREWFIKVTRSSFSSIAASSHVIDSFAELKDALCSFSYKPPEAVEALEFYAVHAARFYVFLTERGIPESATVLAEFVQAVLQKFLANPTHCNASDRSWILAHRVLSMVSIVPSSVDILLTVKSTVHQVETEFIKAWAGTHGQRDLRFIAFAVSQMDILLTNISARVTSQANAVTFGYTMDE